MAATSSKDRTRRAPVLLFLGISLLFSITSAHDRVSVDVHAASVQAWRIATDGAPWLDEIRRAPEIAGDWFIAEASNGHLVAHRMAGPVIAGVPAYWLMPSSPYPEQFTLVPAAVTAALISALAVLLLFIAVRPHVSTRLAVTGSLAFALATPTWSVSANGLWTHTVTQFGLAGAAYAASRGRWWLTGMFFATAMLGRPHLALIAAAVGLGCAWSRRSAGITISIGVSTTLALAGLAAWNRWMFGEWSIGGAYHGRAEAALSGQDSQWVNYAGFLVSPDRGFLIWTPALLLILPAVVRSWSTLPDWSRWLIPGGLIYTVAQLRLNHFAGGDAFYGHRHGLELLTCLAPSLILASRELRSYERHTVAALLGVQVGAITLGAVTESFLLPLGAVWSDNSFWFALRQQPAIVGTWLALCVASAVVLSVTTARRAVTST